MCSTFLPPSFCLFTFLLLVLAQLHLFCSPRPLSGPHLHLLGCFSDNEQRRRVVVRVSAAVYSLSNVLQRGRKSSVRLIVPVFFVCIQMVHNRFIETAAIPLFAIVKMTLRFA